MSFPVSTSPALTALVTRANARPALRGAMGLALVLIASSSVQVSAVLSRSLFDHLNPLSVSGLRFAIAATIMIAVIRPRITGRTTNEWFAIGLYGLAIASMNIFMYQSLAFLPLGVAITLEFLGPFAVALLASRKPRQALFAFLGLAGVVLIARPSADFAPIGLVFGCLAAIALGSYVLIADRIAQRGGGVAELALAFGVAALATAPFAASAVPSIRLTDAPVLLISAVLGCVLAFTADFLAVQVTGARTVAILLSLDPVLAALIGAFALGEHLDALTLAGMAAVATAGGLAAFTSGHTPHSACRSDCHAVLNDTAPDPVSATPTRATSESSTP